MFDYGRTSGWKSIEFRGAQRYFEDTPAAKSYFVHTLPLCADPDVVFSRFRKGTKSTIKKAARIGIEVNRQNSLTAVKQFYRLNCLSRQRHGVPPQPFRFFKHVYECVISKGLGWVVLAFHRGIPIAGAVFFGFGGGAICKYDASVQEQKHLGANNLVLWEAIRWFAQQGYKSLCFGRTDPDDEGLRRFKNGWGTIEEPIGYYKYDLGKNSYIRSSDGLSNLWRSAFRLTPLTILRLIGALAYRHLG